MTYVNKHSKYNHSEHVFLKSSKGKCVPELSWYPLSSKLLFVIEVQPALMCNIKISSCVLIRMYPV